MRQSVRGKHPNKTAVHPHEAPTGHSPHHAANKCTDKPAPRPAISQAPRHTRLCARIARLLRPNRTPTTANLPQAHSLPRVYLEDGPNPLSAKRDAPPSAAPATRRSEKSGHSPDGAPPSDWARAVPHTARRIRMAAMRTFTRRPAPVARVRPAGPGRPGSSCNHNRPRPRAEAEWQATKTDAHPMEPGHIG